MKQSLKEKGFERSFRSQGAKEIPVDKNVFIMYAVEMLINVARGYNAIGYHKTALAHELDIKYIYDLLRKQGRSFCSQEFQFNVVHGETSLLKGVSDMQIAKEERKNHRRNFRCVYRKSGRIAKKKENNDTNAYKNSERFRVQL